MNKYAMLGGFLALVILTIATTRADDLRPDALKSNLGWWSADDNGANATLVDVSLPEDVMQWTDKDQSFTITGGQPDPTGTNNAYQVMENPGAGARWLALAPEGYVAGPCQIQFTYKSVGGASVWVYDRKRFSPEFEFTADGEVRIGKHPSAHNDNTWYAVTVLGNGFYKVDLWIGGINLQNGPAFSTASALETPAPGDASKGMILADVKFSQCYITGLNDSSARGIHLTAQSEEAPFFQKSTDVAGLLLNKSCLWQPEMTFKFLSSSDPALCAALSGTNASTVMGLVRRQWARSGRNGPAKFFKAVSESGDSFAVGFAPGNRIHGNEFFAGKDVKTGLLSEVVSNQEWNVVTAVTTGTGTTIYLSDGTETKPVAGPMLLPRGTIKAVQIGAQRSALREAAVWGEALDAETIAAQARGMIARAGGLQGLNTVKTFDGITIETRSRSTPFPWRDDAGTAFYKGACWILGGALKAKKPSNDVWKSTDYGATWTEVAQVQPAERSAGAAGFTLKVDGKTYLYWMNCVGSDQHLYRSLDGSSWEKMGEDPPWRENTGQGVGILGNDIYVMGGQTKKADPDTAVNHVYKSSDGGATWKQLPDAPWSPRGAFGPLLTTWKEKIWVTHGGKRHGVGGGEGYENDIWSFDGSQWERVLEHTPWSGTIWNTTFVLNDEFFILAGIDARGFDHRMLWRSKDGVHWTSVFPLPWGVAHETGAIETDRGVLLVPAEWEEKVARLLKFSPGGQPELCVDLSRKANQTSR